MAKDKETKKENICNVCGKPYEYALTVKTVNGKQSCEHDSPTAGPSKIAKRRSVNVEASVMALRMAAEQKKIDSETGDNKMIPVKSTQKGKGYGQTEMIPEKVIKSIEEKVKEEPALMEGE